MHNFCFPACDKKGRWALEEDVEGMAINFVRNVAPGAFERRFGRLIFQNSHNPFDNLMFSMHTYIYGDCKSWRGPSL